jgi:hypothetical protein
MGRQAWPPSHVSEDVLGLIGWILRPAYLLWSLHWIVVDAFDGARVLRPGQTLAQAEADDARPPEPWFVRAIWRIEGQKWRAKRRGFGGFCDRYSSGWREEIAILSAHPALAVGFGLATAALLAIPGVNILFRPIVTVGAAHLLGQLEDAGVTAPAVRPLATSK